MAFAIFPSKNFCLCFSQLGSVRLCVSFLRIAHHRTHCGVVLGSSALTAAIILADASVNTISEIT